jgi:hypothetical protein
MCILEYSVFAGIHVLNEERCNKFGEHFASQSRSSDHVRTYPQRWQGPMCLNGELPRTEMKRSKVHALRSLNLIAVMMTSK